MNYYVLAILTLGAVMNGIFTVQFARGWAEATKELKAHREERRLKTAVLHDLHKRTHREKIKYTFVFATNTLSFSAVLMSKIIAIYGL